MVEDDEDFEYWDLTEWEQNKNSHEESFTVIFSKNTNRWGALIIIDADENEITIKVDNFISPAEAVHSLFKRIDERLAPFKKSLFIPLSV